MYKSLKTYLASSLALIITIFMFSNSIQAQGNVSPDSDTKTVVDVVKSESNTSKFAEMLDKSGFAQVLSQPKSKFTVLAPKNGAIENADSQLKQNPKQLVQGHLFQGNVSKKQVESQMGVTVEKTDKSAANGTVYVVDKIASSPRQQQ